ncbi:hypothetical protein PQX77_014041 [Marasmius sp. AFHP31]|nr:hypothetical protein PQX77_014041 [Marasmius sp. AFHP31]
MLSSGASAAIVPFVLDGATVTGDRCMHTQFNTTLQQWLFAINTVQGTCIILAMSSSFALSPVFTLGRGFIGRVKASVVAKDLPTFSKSLLRHSQGYYLLLVSVNLFTAIWISIYAIPLAYRVGMLFVIYAVLHCASSSIFRNIGKARYVTQDLDDLSLSFRRSEPSTPSSRHVANSVLEAPGE